MVNHKKVLTILLIVSIILGVMPFSISASADIPDVQNLPDISVINTQYYTGGAITPQVTILDDQNNKLIDGKDFSITYYNNTNIGTATVIATGIGNYTGVKKQVFQISLAPPIVKTVESYKSVTLTWQQVPGACAYIIYRYSADNTKWIELNTLNNICTYKDINRIPNKKYIYRVQALMSLSDNNGVSSYTDITATTKTATKTKCYKANAQIKLYATPSMASNVVAKLKKGNKVKIVYGYIKHVKKTTWYKAIYNEKTVYVNANKLLKNYSKFLKSNINYDISETHLTALQQAITNIGREKVSFTVIDIKTGSIFTFNENKQVYSASTIKGPYIINIMENYIKNDRNELNKIYFKRGDYPLLGGTGTMQYDSSNKRYSLKETIKRTIRYSDNIGYYMLRKKFGNQSFKKWLLKSDLPGRLARNNYTYLTSMQLAKMWQYGYNYLSDKTKNQQWLKKQFNNANYSLIGELFSKIYTVYSKPGFMSANLACYNDAGIVKSDGYPYAISVLSDLSGWGVKRQANKEKLLPLLNVLDKIHSEYIKAIS